MNTLGATDILAIYGAVLASITFGWNLYRDLQDRARLKATAHVRRIVQSEDGTWYAVKPDLQVAGASEQLFVVVNVTNIGRRPLRWEGWGGKYRTPVNGKKSFVIIPRYLPKMLNEGESHSEYTEELNPRWQNLKKLTVWDASGKNWYVPRRELKALRRQLREPS